NRDVTSHDRCAFELGRARFDQRSVWEAAAMVARICCAHFSRISAMPNTRFDTAESRLKNVTEPPSYAPCLRGRSDPGWPNRPLLHVNSALSSFRLKPNGYLDVERYSCRWR